MVKSKRTQESEQLLWIVDHAAAHVENGAVTVQIDKPTRFLPRPAAFMVADDIWFAGQMRELEIARQRGETKEIPLTDRRRRSSLRLGGGFMITQGTNLVIIRRHLNAPRPGQFCECGGVFEVLEPESEDEEADVLNDYIASLLKESQEIILIRGGTLYIPQLAPSPSVQIGFQPPGTLSAYNKIIEEEVITGVEKAHMPVDPKKIKKFWMKMLDYERAVKLEFAYSPQLSVEITAEIDSSSLECVGVLSFPQDIDAAVIAFLEEELIELRKDASRNASRINEIETELQEVKKELEEWKGEEGHGFQYWDAELGWDSKLKREGGPVDREVHLINIENGDDIIWYNELGKRVRTLRRSTLWDELSTTKLGKTSGRFATEKIEKAIRMHCPYPRLQPLARL